MRNNKTSAAISLFTITLFAASLLLPTLASAATLSGGKAYPNVPHNEIRFLHAGSLELDEYVIPSWVDYEDEQDIVTGDENWSIDEIIEQAVLVDEDTIEIGEATLSRLGETDVWRVEAWICTVQGDVVSCGWETLGLLSTDGFDLADTLVRTQLALDPTVHMVQRDTRMIAICTAISVVAIAAATMCIQGDVNLTFNVLGYDANLTC